MTVTIPCRVDHEHRRTLVGGEPMLFHCHHYNTFLQRSIRDASFIESRPYLIGAAAEVAYAQLSKLFEQEHLDDVETRSELAAELYRWAGFGLIDFSGVDAEGGRVETDYSHYAFAWRLKFGPSKEAVCFFASGWLAGAAAAIHGLEPGAFRVEHTSCRATDESLPCAFELTRGEPNYELFESVGGARVSATQELRPEPETNVDRYGIYTALSGLDISGDAQGSIPAFGVYLTRNYANYFNRISFETLRSVELAFGEEGYDAARPLLVEAGHVCAFNTFGGIMTSTEWDALIRPTCRNDEDWVHGIVAAINTLGWGRWQATSVDRDSARFVIHDDYESVGYRAMYGRAERPVSFLAEGAAAGIMNLVYRGAVSSKPSFGEAFYDRLFREAGAFVAEPALSSVACGDEVTEIFVHRT